MRRGRMGRPLFGLPIFLLFVAACAAFDAASDPPHPVTDAGSDVGSTALGSDADAPPPPPAGCAQAVFEDRFESGLEAGWTPKGDGTKTILRVDSDGGTSHGSALTVIIPDTEAVEESYLQRNLDPAQDCVTFAVQISVSQVTAAGSTFLRVLFANDYQVVAAIIPSTGGMQLAIGEQTGANYLPLGKSKSVSVDGRWRSFQMTYAKGPKYTVTFDGVDVALSTPHYAPSGPSAFAIGNIYTRGHTPSTLHLDNVGYD